MGAVCNTQKKYKSSKEVPISTKELQLTLTSLNRNFSEKLIIFDTTIKKLKGKVKAMLTSEIAAKSQFNLSVISNLIIHQKIQAKIARGHESSKDLLAVYLETAKESEEDFGAVQGLAAYIESVIYAVELMICLKKKPFDKLQKKLEATIITFYGEPKYKELKLFENLRESVRPEDLPKQVPNEQEINDFLVAFGNENNINPEVINQVSLKAGLASNESPVEERKQGNGNYTELENIRNDRTENDLKSQFMGSNANTEGIYPNANILEKINDEHGMNHANHNGEGSHFNNFQKQIVNGDSLGPGFKNKEADGFEYADLEGQIEEEKKPYIEQNHKRVPSKINAMPQTNGRLNNSITTLNTMNTMDKRQNNQKNEQGNIVRELPKGFKVLSDSFDADPKILDQDDSGNYSSELEVQKHQTEKTPELVINGLIKSTKNDFSCPVLRVQSTTQERLQELLQGFNYNGNDPSIYNKRSFATNEENLFALWESSQLKLEGNDTNSAADHKKLGNPLKSSFKDDANLEHKEKKQQHGQPGKHYTSSEIMMKYEKLKSKCANNAQNFVDPEFSTESQKTIAHHPQSFLKETKIEWKRLWESFLKEGILPETMENDCLRGATAISSNFLLALNLLTLKPELLSMLIHPLELTKEGIYCVSLCDAGKWTSLLIDDYVTFVKGTGQLGFSKSKDNQLWIPILEKALSKLFGSYQALSLARDETIIRTLAGASCQMFEIGPDVLLEPSLLLHALSKLFQDGYTLYAKKFKKESHSDTDLIKCSIITDIKVQEPTDSELNLKIQLSNVFDLKESKKIEDSPLIDNRPNETTSWKSLQAFQAEFNKLVVVRTTHNAYYNSIDLNYNLLDTLTDEYPNVSLIQITTSTPTPATLSVVQKPYEYYAAHGKPKYKYSFVRMTIGKLDPYGRVYDLVKANFDAVYDLNLEYSFDEGTYLVMIEFFWNNEEAKNAVFSVNSAQDVALEKVKCNQLKYTEVIEQLCSVYAHKELSLEQPPEDKTISNIISPTFKRRVSTKLKGFLLVIYKNESEEVTSEGHLTLINKERKGFLQCVPALVSSALPIYDKKFSVLPQRSYLFVFKLQDLDPVPFDEGQS